MKSEIVKSNLKNTINDVYLIETNLFTDERGFFMESWNHNEFNNLICKEINFKQDNHSKSFKGVLRGLHYQTVPYTQGKLVRCINGEIYDVIVDLRKNSSTFLEWAGILLNSKNKYQLWVPDGFAHGFLTLTDVAEVIYKTTDYWSRDHERTIKWNDPQLSINWPNIDFEPFLSEKDLQGNLICNLKMDDFF